MARRPDEDRPLTPGIPDPEDPSRWLVWPWRLGAGFCDVVRHFLTVYVGSLQGDRNTARQLAYWEGYQTALTAASTDELTHAAALHWHADMVRCVGDCVAVFREKAEAENVHCLRPQEAAVVRLVGRRGRAS
jgi:hypothetical protein